MEEVPDILPKQIASVLRHGLTFLGGFLLSKGYITAEIVPQFIAGGLALSALGWSIVQQVNSHKALKDAVAAPAGRLK